MSELDRLKDFQRKIESGELDDHYSDNGWAAIEEIKSTLTQLIEEKESNSMKKIFKFKCGIVSGTDMQTVLEIIPELEKQFEQRKQFFDYYWKQFFEYYFTEKEISVTIHQLDALAKEFSLTINWESITLENN